MTRDYVVNSIEVEIHQEAKRRWMRHANLVFAHYRSCCLILEALLELLVVSCNVPLQNRIRLQEIAFFLQEMHSLHNPHPSWRTPFFCRLPWRSEIDERWLIFAKLDDASTERRTWVFRCWLLNEDALKQIIRKLPL